MLDLFAAAFRRINDLEVQTMYLQKKITDLKVRLSRKPKPQTTQVQLTFEFDLEEEVVL